MQPVYDELMDSYQRLKERKYTILEQKKGGQYGNMPWAIPNDEFDANEQAIVKMGKDAENKSLKISQSPKEQVNQMYAPVILASDTSRVWWIGQSGTHTANIQNFIDYINSKSQDSEEGEKAAQAEMDAQAQQEAEENAPLPWMPAQLTQGQMDELEGLNGQIPGFNLSDITETIVGDPNFGGKSVVRKFFRLIYETPDTRSMTPAVQLELVKVSRMYAEIATKAVTQDDGTRVIDDTKLDDAERDLLNASVCRNVNKGGMFFGRQGSDESIGAVAPEFLSWTRALKKEFAEGADDSGTYSMAFKYASTGGPGAALCEYFGDTFIDKDGVKTKAVKSSNQPGASKIAQNLGTVKEHLMVDIMNVAFQGVHSGKMEELVEDWQRFSASVGEICARNDDIELGIPVGGVLETEDSQQMYESMKEATGVDECGGIAKAYIKDSIKESLALAKLVRKAKVRPVEVVHQGKGSDSNDKKDFSIVLSSPEDTAKLYSTLKEQGIDVSMEGNLEVSLKAYSNFVRTGLKAGTGSFQKNSRYAGVTDVAKVAPQYRNEFLSSKAGQDAVRTEFATNPIFNSIPDKPQLIKDIDKANKLDKWATEHVLDVCLNPRARKSGSSALRTALEDIPLPKTGPGRAIAIRLKKNVKKLGSMNKKDSAKFAVDYIKLLRHNAVSRNPRMARAFAASDVVNGFMTAQDEALTMVGKGKISMVGTYQVIAHVIGQGEARINQNGAYTFFDPESGKSWGGASLREKANRVLIDTVINSSVILALAKFLEESRGSSDPLIESIYGKLEELLESIHVAVAR